MIADLMDNGDQDFNDEYGDYGDEEGGFGGREAEAEHDFM